MREYELCCEIFNQCSNNQMRDVDFSEVSVEDTDGLPMPISASWNPGRKSSGKIWAGAWWCTIPTRRGC